MSVARAYLWMILRVDNFVCSNCQDNYQTKYYPVNCEKYLRNDLNFSLNAEKQDSNMLTSGFRRSNSQTQTIYCALKQCKMNHITKVEFSKRMKSFIQQIHEASNDTVETQQSFGLANIKTEAKPDSDVELVTPISNSIWK
ncbi:Hypothetical_protein [Hexamita inflata]|uniref:Hypothetical_protein n=1 Tax=Hexamita inflata TaxID=28002 RepID=A0AA86N531_9EUKA|nr:Hypothetical protein HINF_LOCUS364 [Hexamita inflata]